MRARICDDRKRKGQIALPRWGFALSLVITCASAFATISDRDARQPLAGHLNLGRVATGSTNRCDLVWSNSFGVPLDVGISPSCAHVQILNRIQHVAPGATAHISASVIADKPGPFTVGVNLDLQGLPEERCLFVVSGVAGPIVSSPKTKGFLVDPGSLIAHPEKLREWTLVDTRASTDFQTAHVPGALNLPLYSLKAQRALQKKNMLLLGDGISDNALVDEAARLTEQGFIHVRVLQGGLRRWQQLGGNIAGDAKDVGALSPRDLWAGQGNLRWCFIDVSPKPCKHSFAAPVKGFSVPFDIETRSFEEKLRRLGVNKQNYDAILIYDEIGSAAPELKRWAASTRLMPAFVLEGGSSAYSRYLIFETQLHQRSTQSLAKSNPLDMIRTVRSSPSAGNTCGCGR